MKNKYIDTEVTCLREVDIDDNTEEVKQFSIEYKGNLNGWIEEFLQHPEGSRLQEDLIKKLTGVLKSTKRKSRR